MKKNYQQKIVKEVKSYTENELDILITRSIFSELRFSSYLRFYFLYRLNKFGVNRNLNRVNYFCPKTKQMKGIVKFFNIYRMPFRENVSFARYSGIKRSSW